MKECINCGAESSNKFCPICGQKLEVPKVTWRSIADEIGSHWLGFNNKFFRAIRYLTIKPEVVIQSYLKGNRVRYIGPLGYLVVMSALYILAFDYLEIDKADYFRRIQEAIAGEIVEDPSRLETDLIVSTRDKLAEYLRLIPAMNIPLVAFAVWIFFRKIGNTYLENVVAISYSQAHLLWLTIVSLVVFKFTDTQMTVVWELLSLAYYTFVITRFYYRKNYFVTGLKSLLSVLVGYLFILIFSGILNATIGYIIGYSQTPS